MNLTELIEKYGSDKSLSGYDNHYKKLFSFFVDRKINYLEIGLGTLIGNLPSTFIGNPSHYPHYEPSAILKVWREYFKNANIYGIDIGEDCMLHDEDRITTKIVDSTNSDECNNFFPEVSFDIILDDGLHTSEGQRKTFNNFFNRVNDYGLYVIEDLGGGGDGINMFTESYDEIMQEINKHEYFFGGNILVVYKNHSNKGNVGIDLLIDAISKNENNLVDSNSETNLTIVTGLWNINRVGRDFNHYIETFKRFLDIPQNLFIYIPKEYEYLVWEKRSKENTHVKIHELDDVKKTYQPFWDRTQKIRTDENWYSQAGWLSGSPQASNEWYNPIVQSKMFMLNDASIWNPFDSEYFYWLDAGITNTVPHGHLAHDNVLEQLPKYSNPFLFLSYPYEADKEIHGFEYQQMNNYVHTNEEVKYVCRGGLFGGHKEQIHEANATYYGLLDRTLSHGLMGTEESLFTIMSYNEPDLYRRYELDGNGLIVKFTNAVINNDVNIVVPPNSKIKNVKKYTDRDVQKLKTNLYVLTFNFPEQVLHTIESMKKTPIWLEKPNLFLLDNSEDESVRERNREVAKEHGFEYISLGGNTGICGGRQAAAEHFNESDADFMFFFEDDMTVNPPSEEGKVCRNGFRKYVPNLYNIVHKIMLKEQFDFLKLSFTEVYFDNDIQCSWYNVPQKVRTEFWPEYDRLPVHGLDPNAPRTKFNNIGNVDGVTYVDGEIYYANWPMIVSKEGNKKMFIDTKWAHPFEQTWMSHMYQMTKRGELKPGLLLASPIWHDRIKHYDGNIRREN